VPQENDLRGYPRVTSPRGTFLAWSTAGRRLVSRVDNFALGGMFISVADPLSPGSYIQLLFDAPEGEIRARAVVRRSSPLPTKAWLSDLSPCSPKIARASAAGSTISPPTELVSAHQPELACSVDQFFGRRLHTKSEIRPAAGGSRFASTAIT